jgi:hypothetical protein
MKFWLERVVGAVLVGVVGFAATLWTSVQKVWAGDRDPAPVERPIIIDDIKRPGPNTPEGG